MADTTSVEIYIETCDTAELVRLNEIIAQILSKRLGD